MRRLATLALLVVVAFGACGRAERLPTPRRIIAGGEATPTPTPTPSATPKSRSAGKISVTPGATTQLAGGDLANVQVKLTKITTLQEPLAMAIRANDSAFYIAEKGGRIKSVRKGQVDDTVLDISSEVAGGYEQGLLGLAFSADGSRLYVNFTNTAGDTVIREYAFSAAGANTASARIVLEIDQPASNHNGGNLMFGPEGYLYIGMGDGGGGPGNTAQDTGSLLGKMLRIDPAQSGPNAYTSPSDNPYFGPGGGRDEIWAIGLRNPWRWSFDRQTRDLVIGDVGAGSWEEVDYQPASSDGGENYGWPLREGTHQNQGPPPAGHVQPIYEYSLQGENCAITGGFVYRGTRIANLQGAYVFADHCAGRLRAFELEDGKAKNHRFLGPRTSQLSSFGEDRNGNLYAMSLDGDFYRLDPA